MPPRERKWRRRRIVLVSGLVLALFVSAAAAYVVTRKPGDVSNPDVEFRAEPSATPEQEVEPDAPGKKKTDPFDRFIWPIYGYTRDRRRYLPLKDPPHPPFDEVWRFSGNVLLEFPPVIGGKRLYLLNDHGKLFCIDKGTGKVRWRRKLGALAAASPAYADGKVYVVLLQRAETGGGAKAGRVVALDGKSGKVEWSNKLASRSESSPLIADGRLYFGAENGTVYAMDTRTGRTDWRFQAGGAVKGGVALADGKLYFGAYGGHIYAIRQSDGRKVWDASSTSGAFGIGAGNFYSTPAVAYGRVYIGNTNGSIYSYSAASGKLAWSHGTGGYVYASPAVAQVPGGRPLVYAGSYNGRFYALDARSGREVWSRGGNGKISGGATVIGDIVYYADLGNRLTVGLDARSGRKVYEHERGSYNPVVSDGRTIFLTGYHVLYALREPTAEVKKARRSAAAARAARNAKERRACAQVAKQAHRGKPKAIRRSVERCVDRKRARRRAAKRHECAKVARKAHKGQQAKLRRSYERCLVRKGLRQSA